MFHLAAYARNIDPAGVFTLVGAAQESTLLTDGINGIKIPSDLSFLVGRAALFNTATATRAEFLTPSLNDVGGIPCEPFGLVNGFAVPAELAFHPDAPIMLEPEEMLSFGVVSTPGASILHSGFVWLSDGPLTPIIGEMFSVRATANAVQEQRLWKEGVISFTEPLPIGVYVIVGMRVRATSGAVARLIFANQRARPGVPLVDGIEHDDTRAFRFGAAGVFGTFRHDLPPVLEVLNGTATSQTLILDLVRF